MSRPAVDLLTLADQRFVSLTTYRRSGEPVSTPVWIAQDHDALVVTTGAGSGKVKRLRNNPRVELRPCSRLGRVPADAVSVTAHATVLTDDLDRRRFTRAIRRKYGLEYLIVMAIERLSTRRRAPRVILHIT